MIVNSADICTKIVNDVRKLEMYSNDQSRVINRLNQEKRMLQQTDILWSIFGRELIFLCNSITMANKIKELPIAKNTYIVNIYDNWNTVNFEKILSVMQSDYSKNVLFVFITPAYTENSKELIKFGYQENNNYVDGRMLLYLYDKAYNVKHYDLTDKTIKTYVVTHKKIDYVDETLKNRYGYSIILAGASSRADDFGYLRDDMLDGQVVENISELNPFLNEATAIYWIWKHAKEDIVGIAHYRRYWIKDGCPVEEKYIVTEDDMRQYMSECDVIISEPPLFLVKNSYELLGKAITNHELLDQVIELVRNLIQDKQPSYIESFQNMLDGTVLYPCNMLMARKEIYNAYCKWAFSFMIEATRSLDLSKYQNTSNIRSFGFVFEYLLYVWLGKQDYKIKKLKSIVLPDEAFK